MRLIFVSNNWEDPHQQARLRKFEQWGLQPVTFAFTRSDLPNISKSSPYWKYPVTHGRYLKRGCAYLSFCQSLIRTLRRGDLIYVLGFDLLLLVYLCKLLRGHRPRVIYELPDIREVLFHKSLAGQIARLLEAWVLPRVHLLVVTSEDYVTAYLIGMRNLAVRDYLVLENKLESNPARIETRSDPAKIRIGYLGILRCSYTLECLIRLAQTGHFTVHIHGILMPSTRHLGDRLQNQSNIEYHGPYRYPLDLTVIYSNIDVLWAGYPISESKNGNHLWARTNRFYEGLYFRKPMILVEGTADACRAKTLGSIAVTITPGNPSDTALLLMHSLDSPSLVRMQQELAKIHPSEYILSTEYDQLQKWIMNQ